MSAMGAVWLRLRAELRHQWRAWLALAVLLGVIGGIALTAAAGARRTDTAYPRFLRAQPRRAAGRVPGAVRVRRLFPRRRPPAGGVVVGIRGVPADVPAGPGRVAVLGPDRRGQPRRRAKASALDRVKVLAGRLFDPADPHAVMISQQLADREHLRPGGTLHLIGYPQRGPSPDVAHAVRLAFRVSAIVAFTDQIVAASNPTRGCC